MPANTTMASITMSEDDLLKIKLECLRKYANVTPPSEPYCQAVFDGWSCWPHTPAGKTAYAPCPEFITGFDPTLYAHKECEPNGTWYVHPETYRIWSNYTSCINYQDFGWQQQLNVLNETGYTISLVALLISLAILTYFRSLRCARITLHMNLFVSFAVNNMLWLIWYVTIVPDPQVLYDNGILCRLVHVVLHYFLLTNYAWMLCEGFYLHTLLVSAFTSEYKLVKWLMALGWSVPAVIVTIYTYLRAGGDKEDTIQCWINDGNYRWVLLYPVCVSMNLNLMFLCNIVRVLLTKLRAGPAIGSQPSRSILQAFRATLLLVPLLGLQYLLVPFRPEKGHPWAQIYDIISAITASFQGLCVAVLFCFCNGEVIAQFKRKWEGTAFSRNRANSCTATTVSVRWRERRRYDYQSAPMVDPKDEFLVITNNIKYAECKNNTEDDESSTTTNGNSTAANRGTSRLFFRRTDSGAGEDNDNEYQYEPAYTNNNLCHNHQSQF